MLQDNYNAFHLAVLYSREDIIKNLLARKVDISVLAGVRNKKYYDSFLTNDLINFIYIIITMKKSKAQNVLHLVASRTGGAGATVAKLLLASGAKDFRLARDQVRRVMVYIRYDKIYNKRLFC